MIMKYNQNYRCSRNESAIFHEFRTTILVDSPHLVDPRLYEVCLCFVVQVDLISDGGTCNKYFVDFNLHMYNKVFITVLPSILPLCLWIFIVASFTHKQKLTYLVYFISFFSLQFATNDNEMLQNPFVC